MNVPGHLVWRCRRGMAELDRLLGQYLDGPYRLAGADERRAFERLLELQDGELWLCLSGRSEPEDPALAALAKKIGRIDYSVERVGARAC
ncbi:MAG: succinate dehydrogenase assembly factor 2 [Methylococcus sp.]|nr:succinate dehydrogenase assembly factor 2 [Methylococcus sp.]